MNPKEKVVHTHTYNTENEKLDKLHKEAMKDHIASLKRYSGLDTWPPRPSVMVTWPLEVPDIFSNPKP